jgi:hypothetical protein
MSMSPTIPGIESLSLIVTQEIHVKASLQTTFEALLEQLGPENETGEQKMPMKLEAWPGGRWFRDLGDGNGHFWGHVQAIKRPQYRLSEEKGGTLIKFHHKAFGLIQDEHREGVSRGWGRINVRVKERAEAKAK